ncbi:MAG TPA: hypothetical protein VIO64_09580 [Pseudobacteroides sp.]|uniref:hypothetical protein n=1 Tax=Pseudobacteroides sp. TaxID=1968840 RepID=UPI002F94D6EF
MATLLFAIGRGNWLFCDTLKGEEASGLRPYDYLAYLLEEIQKNIGVQIAVFCLFPHLELNVKGSN